MASSSGSQNKESVGVDFIIQLKDWNHNVISSQDVPGGILAVYLSVC